MHHTEITGTGITSSGNSMGWWVCMNVPHVHHAITPNTYNGVHTHTHIMVDMTKWWLVCQAPATWVHAVWLVCKAPEWMCTNTHQYNGACTCTIKYNDIAPSTRMANDNTHGFDMAHFNMWFEWWWLDGGGVCTA